MCVCGKKYNGKSVAGYAWTYNGWFGYYHYITLCPSSFTLESMDTKFEQVEKELGSGSTEMATNMAWLRTTGQFFLHEMMHTRIADGGKEPQIIDEYVRKIDKGELPDRNERKAYGPAMVHMLARMVNDGGGATRASTNADSYAMLANATWWWDTTEYFPGVPGKSLDNDDFPISLHIDLGNSTNLATVDFNRLFSDDLTTFGSGPPDAVSSNSAAPSSTPPPTSTSSAAAPPPAATDDCNVKYDVVFGMFDIKGRNFEDSKIGQDGSALKHHLAKCGAVTKYSFKKLTKDSKGFQWQATGKLPIGVKSCVGNVMAGLGGDKGSCTGAG